jgi:hypothetical protein
VDKQRALRHVANHVAATMRAQSFQENTGTNPHLLRLEDFERLGWAIAEVTRRLDHITLDGGDTDSSVIDALAENPIE